LHQIQDGLVEHAARFGVGVQVADHEHLVPEGRGRRPEADCVRDVPGHEHELVPRQRCELAQVQVSDERTLADDQIREQCREPQVKWAVHEELLPEVDFVNPVFSTVVRVSYEQSEERFGQSADHWVNTALVHGDDRVSDEVDWARDEQVGESRAAVFVAAEADPLLHLLSEPYRAYQSFKVYGITFA